MHYYISKLKYLDFIYYYIYIDFLIQKTAVNCQLESYKNFTIYMKMFYLLTKLVYLLSNLNTLKLILNPSYLDLDMCELI